MRRLSIIVITALFLPFVTSCTSAEERRGGLLFDHPSKLSMHDELQEVLDHWSEQTSFNGVIAVTDAESTTHTYVTGVADKDSGRELTVESVFQTGSIGKFFLSVAAFRLAETGVVDLDEPISTYLPAYRTDTGDRITLAHLITNRSGLPENYRSVMGEVIALEKSAPETDRLPLSLAEGIQEYGSGDLKFDPGSSFDYVNVNWILAQHILESVTGKSYLEVLEATVIEPAGLTDTGVFVWDLHQTSPLREDIAIGHNPVSNMLASDWPLPAFVGGGTYTTANDMSLVLKALYGGRLLNTDSLERFSTITTASEDYAYGGRLVTRPSAPEIAYSWQSGSNGATELVAVHNLRTGYTFVAFSNILGDTGEMFDLAISVESRLSTE